MKPNLMDNNKSTYLEEMQRIILSGLQGYNVKVYLFGSVAQGKTGRSSDIDVAILPMEPLPAGVLSAIRETLEESRIPYTVDLVDLSQADVNFSNRVIKEGLLWYS